MTYKRNIKLKCWLSASQHFLIKNIFILFNQIFMEKYCGIYHKSGTLENNTVITLQCKTRPDFGPQPVAIFGRKG